MDSSFFLNCTLCQNHLNNQIKVGKTSQSNQTSWHFFFFFFFFSFFSPFFWGQFLPKNLTTHKVFNHNVIPHYIFIQICPFKTWIDMSIVFKSPNTCIQEHVLQNIGWVLLPRYYLNSWLSRAERAWLYVFYISCQKVLKLRRYLLTLWF